MPSVQLGAILQLIRQLVLSWLMTLLWRSGIEHIIGTLLSQASLLTALDFLHHRGV